MSDKRNFRTAWLGAPRYCYCLNIIRVALLVRICQSDSYSHFCTLYKPIENVMTEYVSNFSLPLTLTKLIAFFA